jgi:hypothetical protein
VVAHGAEGRRTVIVEEPPPLVGREPVAQAHAESAEAFHPANSGGQLGTEQPGIGGLIGNAAYGRQPEVDGRRRVVLLFQVNPVADRLTTASTTKLTCRGGR